MRIQSRRVWIGGQFVGAQLELEEGKIRRILPYDCFPDAEDWGDLRLVPGMIDLHTHGAWGFDTNDGEPEGLRNWVRRLPEEGVTAFLPTTITQEKSILLTALSNVAAVARENPKGAQILGVHLEGPFINPDYCGAQPRQAVQAPRVELFREFQNAAEGMIRYITLAPEMDRDFALTRYCSGQGVTVSMGHSGASYDQALLAAANGALSMTHVYNAMPPFHHRSPGLAGAALRIRDLYGEIICDGFHCHRAVLNNFFQAKGRDYGLMVTDSLRAKGWSRGNPFLLGGQEVEIGADGQARIKGTDTIAGSTLAMNQGLRILVEEAMVPFDAALNACTINPARCLGVHRSKGRLAAGWDGDLVALRKDYSVAQTWCRGRKML